MLAELATMYQTEKNSIEDYVAKNYRDKLSFSEWFEVADLMELFALRKVYMLNYTSQSENIQNIFDDLFKKQCKEYEVYINEI